MHRPLREKFVAEARRALKIPWKRRWIILLVLIAAGLLAAVRLGRSDGPAYYTSRVETGDIKQVVEATGARTPHLSPLPFGQGERRERSHEVRPALRQL